MSRIRRHLSYSNVVATLALVLALGAGTVYAASKINGSSVKKNSLPGNRVKKGTLPGNRVKKGTLPGSALKSNSVNGSKIDLSTLGKVPSAQTADTANAAYEVFENPDPVSLPFNNLNNQIVRLELPVGKYAVSGKITLVNTTGAMFNHSPNCSLLAGQGFFDLSSTGPIPESGQVTLAMQTVTYLPAAGPVTLECFPNGGAINDLSATQGKITAVSVSDVILGPSAPIPPNNTG
jgi:hypothetical protein